MVLIALSSTSLAFESPLNDPAGTLTLILSVLDVVFTFIFSIEVLVRVLATGFLLNGKRSYMRDSWHIIDFTIVVFSIVGLFPGTGDLSFFKIIRMVRLFRPLRIISKNENLKISIQALFVSMPAIGSLMIIVSLIMFIFAIIAVNLLKGKSFYCQTDDIMGKSMVEIERLI